MQIIDLYFAECLKMVSENTANAHSGTYPQKHLLDILDPPPPDNRTGDEIAADIIKRAGLVVK